MRDEPIPSALVKLGFPTMIGMIISALYSIVDAYFAGWLGTSEMGAVSVVFPIVQIIVGLGMTFGSGAASCISRLLGERKTDAANRTASTAVAASLVVGGVAIALALVFLDGLLRVLGSTATILPLARAYALIYISGAILTIFNVTMNNAVTAEGAARLAMASMMTGGVLNILLDPLFMITFGMGIQGLAWATVTAQAATSLIYVGYIARHTGSLRFSVRLVTFDAAIYRDILAVGIPILVFQALSSAAMGLTNTAASAFGDAAVAAVGIVTRILTIGTYVIFGFMKGFQPVVGYNFGARRFDRVKEATRLSLAGSTAFCLVVAAAMVLRPHGLIGFFSNTDARFLALGVQALRASGLVFVFFGFQMVWMAFFLAVGRGKEGGILSVSRQGLFFIPAILILPRYWGFEGLIWAQPMADLLTTLLAALFALGPGKKALQGAAK